MADIGARAEARGANAVLNIRFDYTVMGATNGMLMVAATGTAVIVKLSKEDLALEEMREQENVAYHYVEIEGKKRGPFSLVQLRELHAKARILSDDYTFDDDGATGPRIRELVSPAG